MDRLTIEQLKNYLGTGTTFQLGTTERNLTALQSDSKYAFVTAWKGSREKQIVGIESLKPIMYRLSDLDKFIPELGLVPIEELYKLGWSHNQIGLIINGAYTHAAFDIIQILFEWHFWVFDQSYFDKGLIIDKLTYK